MVGQMSKRLRIPILAAVATFALHGVGNPHYGFFRNELYFIVCGQHPQWGYVDLPPVAPLLAAGSQMFGHSLVLLRMIRAISARPSRRVSEQRDSARPTAFAIPGGASGT